MQETEQEQEQEQDQYQNQDADIMSCSSSSSFTGGAGPVPLNSGVGTRNTNNNSGGGTTHSGPECDMGRVSIHASDHDVGATAQKITGKRKRWKLEIECDDQSGGIVDDVIHMVKIICSSNLACDKDINMVNCVSNGQQLLALWKFSQENLPPSVCATDQQ